MGEEEKILFANEAFYAAFAGADMDAMSAIWAGDAAVSVIHPGGDLVSGRGPVLESWQAILSGEDSFDIEMRGASARCLNNVGIVVCYERVGGHNLIATNLFARYGDTWRIVHHQSGPSPVLPPRADGPGTSLN